MLVSFENPFRSQFESSPIDTLRSMSGTQGKVQRLYVTVYIQIIVAYQLLECQFQETRDIGR